MPAGTWAIIIVVALVLGLGFAYLLLKGHLDAKRTAATIKEHSQKFVEYLRQKRKNKEEARKELPPKPKPYDPNAVEDFIDRTNLPWDD